MAKNAANEDKARFVFNRVFHELMFDWKGPEFDFDRDTYKARVQAGDLKGRIVHISQEKLEDGNFSAEHISQELLMELRGELAYKTRLSAESGTEAGFWICIHCGKEHPVLSAGSTGCTCICPTFGQWISVPPSEVTKDPRGATREHTPAK